MAKTTLLRSHGSRWGPGKIHFEESANIALCTGKWIHAERFKGDATEATCKRCLNVTMDTLQKRYRK